MILLRLHEAVRTVLLPVVAAALVGGGIAWLLDAPDAAAWLWIAGTALVLASLTAEIVISLGRREFGLDLIAALAMAGALALGENIADRGGLTVSYDAMKLAQGEGFEDPMIDGYTQDQRFFKNWAVVWRRGFTEEQLRVALTTGPHAPAPFRAIGAPSNMPAFAEAFGCESGDPMVRDGERRVVIW